jgi:hypothetical protein
LVSGLQAHPGGFQNADDILKVANASSQSVDTGHKQRIAGAQEL